MSAAFSTGFGAGTQRSDESRQRKNALTDEQRQQRESLLQRGYEKGELTPAQVAKGIDDLYQHEPQESRFSRVRRFLTRQPAPQQQGQSPQQDFQGIVAGAKKPEELEKQRFGTQQSEESSQRDATVEFIKKYVPQEQQQQALSDYARKQAGVSAGVKNLPGAGGQPVKLPGGGYARPVQDESGNIVMQPMPAGWEPPATKSPSASTQYTNLLAKKLLADRKQGPPLTAEETAQLDASKSALSLAGVERANAWAEAAARNNLIAVTNDDGQDVLVTRKQAAGAATGGQPMTAGVVGSPTAHDKSTQMYATSSLHRLKEMRDIVNKHPEIFGPVGGRTTKASVWLGTQTPDAQKFRQDAQFLAEHSTAVFGGRASATVQALQQVQSDPTTNPEALLAGFESDESTLNDFTTAGGRLPAPRNSSGGTHKVGEKKKFQNGKTGVWDGQGWVAQ